MYLKCLYLRICLPIELNSVHCVHIKKLSLRAAVAPSRSITASMLGVSDRWILSHHKTFKAFLLHLSFECSLVCNVNVANNNINGFCLILFFLCGDWGGFGHPGFPRTTTLLATKLLFVLSAVRLSHSGNVLCLNL